MGLAFSLGYIFKHNGWIQNGQCRQCFSNCQFLIIFSFVWLEASVSSWISKHVCRLDSYQLQVAKRWRWALHDLWVESESVHSLFHFCSHMEGNKQHSNIFYIWDMGQQYLYILMQWFPSVFLKESLFYHCIQWWPPPPPTHIQLQKSSLCLLKYLYVYFIIFTA